MNSISGPNPRFDDWNFGELLNKGIRPLADREPYTVAIMLIDEADNLVRLRTKREQHGSDSPRDYSETWWPKLEEPRRKHADSEESLIHTLTYACRQVYERESTESIQSLDRVLRSKRWNVFNRIRQYLYSLFPNDQTLPWIREFILEYEDYAKGWRYPYEFQLMIRRSCEQLGDSLLSKSEKSSIFESILSQPSKEDHRSWMGDQYSDEAYEEWVRELHRQLLRPFANVLFGEFAEYYEEFENDEILQPISDELYLTVSRPKSGWVSYQSPKSPDDLSKLTDSELLEFINVWDDEHYDKNNWLSQISIKGLSEAFQSVFALQINQNTERLKFWTENGPILIKRPVFIQCMLQTMRAQIESNNLVYLGEYLGFCESLLQGSRYKFDKDSEENGVENRKWEASRREVIDLIEVCTNDNTNVPITYRKQLAGLLEMLCTQFDMELDNGTRVLLDRTDPFTEALNHTRSRALDLLIDFGYWIRKYDDTTESPEVVHILQQRIQQDSPYSLTIPEYAVLGKNISRVYNLNEAWLNDNLSTIFPQSFFAAWQASFESFLHFNTPNRVLLELVGNEYVFAIENLDDFKYTGQFMGDATEVLGEHLFTYYMWGIYPLSGESSLLEKFYNKTYNKPKRWARLFDYVGRSLHDVSSQQLKPLKERLLQFFEWRLSEKVPEELREFAFWLEAECLEIRWRTNAYLRILDVPKVLIMEPGKPRYASIHTMSLSEILPKHPKEVITCFAKLIKSIPSQDLINIPPDEAKTILETGLSLQDDRITQHTEDTREILLRAGHFDLSKLGE